MIGYYLKWALPFVLTTRKHSGKVTRQPTPVPVAPGELPAGVREAFEHTALRLGEHGFVHSALFAVTVNDTPAAAHALHLANPGAGDHAIAYSFGEHEWITFVRAYPGMHVVTANTRQPGVFNPHPRVSTVRSAATEDAARLYALHRAHAAEKGAGAPLPAAPDAGFMEAWERHTMELQVEEGLYTREGRDYRMTLRGALALTRRSLPHAREERARLDAEAAGALSRRAATA